MALSRSSWLLAGGVLFKQGAYALQVALGLQHVGRVLAELGAGLVRLGAVLPLVDDEQGLVLGHVRAFLELHALQEALHAGTHLHELLRPDAAHVFTVDFHVFHAHRLHDDQRRFRLHLLGPRQDDVQADNYHQAFAFFQMLCLWFQCYPCCPIPFPFAKIMPFFQLWKPEAPIWRQNKPEKPGKIRKD